MALGKDSGLNFRIGLATSGFVQGAKRVGNSVNKMNSEFTRFYRGLRTGALYSGIAILARELGGAAKAMIILGQKTKNVEAAFNALAQPGLLDNLRKATGRMLDDFTLMQTSVQFINFGLAQNQLPRFLEFAQKRALQTGESIDHLVRSIVVGLGRKSIKVIDNLSLDVSRFKDIVKETGDWSAALGQIIEEDMGKGAAVATDQVLLLGAAWKNLMTQLAPDDITLKWLADFIDGLTALDKAAELKFELGMDKRISEELDEMAISMGKLQEQLEGEKEGTTIFRSLTQDITDLITKSNELSATMSRFGGKSPFSDKFLKSPPINIHGDTVEEALARKAAELQKEKDIAKALIEQARATERRAKALRDITEDLNLGFAVIWTPEGDVALMEQVNDLLKARIGFEAELAQTVGLFEPPEQLADEWKVVTDDIENNWTGAMTSMINSIARLAQRTKIEFKDIAGILLSVAGLIFSGGTSAGLGGIIGAIFGKKARGGMASGMTLVGEAGPELVNFTSPARVHSAPATQRLLGATGAGGGEVVFHISGDSLVGVLNQKQTKKEYFG